MSKIEWTEETWNPIVGCSLASPGCSRCYAMRQAHRLGANPLTPHYSGLTTIANGRPVWTGRLARASDTTIEKPLTVKRPTVWFVNSMGDLFHEDTPDDWLDRVWNVMTGAHWHTFQVLTKRAQRMQHWCWWLAMSPAVSRAVPDHVWLGVSVEDQRRADERLHELAGCSARVRFVSAEPLLGPLDLSPWLGRDRINWLIVGAESGPGARPMREEWVRDLRDQCVAADVPFFYKQRAERGRKVSMPTLDGRSWGQQPDRLTRRGAGPSSSPDCG